MIRVIFICSLVWWSASGLHGQDELRRLQSALSSIPPSAQRVDTLNDLAFYQLYDNDDPKAAYRSASEAKNLANEFAYTKGIGDAYMRLAQIEEYRGHDVEAAALYRTALQARDKVGDPSYLAAGYYNVGAFFQYNSLLDSAAVYYEAGLQALEQMEEEGYEYHRLKGKLLNSLGDTYMQLGEFRSALAKIQLSLRIREQLNDIQGLANAYLNAGICYYQDRLLDSVASDQALRTSFHLYEDQAHAVGQAQALLNLGNLNYQVGQYDSAQHYYASASRLGVLDGIDTLRIQRNMGNVYFEHNQLDRALDAYQACLTRFRAMGPDASDELATLHYSIGNVHLADRKFNKAIRSLERSRHLADSLNLFEATVASNNALVLAYRLRNRERILYGSMGIVVLILLAGFLVYYLRKRRQMAEQEIAIAKLEVDELLNSQELDLTRARVEGQERERQRIANDLHDQVGMLLSTAKLYLNEPKSNPTEAEWRESQEEYEAIRRIVDEANQEVRRIAHNLAAPYLADHGLVAQLQRTAQTIEQAKKVRVSINTHGMQERLNGLLEIQLYPIITELLSNTLKHAQATEINLDINRFEDKVNITMEDNGVGFDPDKVPQSSNGLGLKGVASRVEALNGSLMIDASPRRGAFFSVDVPLS